MCMALSENYAIISLFFLVCFLLFFFFIFRILHVWLINLLYYGQLHFSSFDIYLLILLRLFPNYINVVCLIGEQIFSLALGCPVPTSEFLGSRPHCATWLLLSVNPDLGNSSDGSNNCTPDTFLGNPDLVPGFWLQPAPVSATVAISGVDDLEALFLFISLILASLCL